MLQSYNSNRKQPKRWEQLTDWIEDAVPFIAPFVIIGAIWMLVWWFMPRCPECGDIVYPVDNYCPECGQQLRTVTNK